MGKKGVSFLSLSAPFLSGGLPNSLHPVQVSSAASRGPHIVFPITRASAHQATYVFTHAHTRTHTHTIHKGIYRQRDRECREEPTRAAVDFSDPVSRPLRG